MTRKSVTSVAMAALCLGLMAAVPTAGAQELVTNGPKATRGDFGDWSAARNVVESQRYDALVASDPGFRRYRMRKECGPITDPQLRTDCLASFNVYEPPMYGSSTPPRRYRHHWNAGY